MKFSRIWFFGVDKKEEDDDWVLAYKGENGIRINVQYSFSGSYRWYEIDLAGKTFGFQKLADAKKFASAFA